MVNVHITIETLMQGVRITMRPWLSPHHLVEVKVTQTQTQTQILAAAAETQT